jgi:hypothetical protein
MAAIWVKLYLKNNVLKPPIYPQPVHCYDTNPPTSRTLCTVTTRRPSAPTVSNLVVTPHTHTQTVIPPEGLYLGYTQFTEAGEVAGKLRLKREDESIENELQRITKVEEHDIVSS